MNIRTLALSLSALGIVVASGCDRITTPATGPAAIVGTIAPGSTTGKWAVLAQGGCPEINVTLNGAAVDVEIDQDTCSFLINNVEPSESIVLEIELPGLGISGTTTISNVVEAELIEVLVAADDDSLSVTIVRQAEPDSVGDLPGFILRNNVTIFLPEGVYEGGITVNGNNFTLVGEAGDDCAGEGWTVTTGNVVVNGNNAVFRNVVFEGSITVEGNNTQFINSCFGGELIIFGNNTDIDDDDNGNDNGDDDDDDNDNGDDDDDDNDNGDDDNDNDDNDNGDDDNGNENDNDDNANDNDDNGNENENGNENDNDDNSNDNDDNSNDNDDNANDNDDNGNENENTNGNDNG